MPRAVPYGWLQLSHDKLKLVAAVGGIAFAVMLVFMQLGLRAALFDSSVRLHRALDYDLIMVSPRTAYLASAKSFPRNRLYQALGMPGVESVSPMYVALARYFHIDLRLAGGSFGFTGFGTPTDDGRSLLWVRMREVEHDAGSFAVNADYVPSVVGNALARIMFSTSLDNTIRFGRLEPTGWVLCDNRMEYAGNGFGHGTVPLWSESGALLATASHSMILCDPGLG